MAIETDKVGISRLFHAITADGKNEFLFELKRCLKWKWDTLLDDRLLRELVLRGNDS